MSTARILTRGAAMFIAVTCASGSAFSQSCAMCYTSAAAARAEGIRALQHGILILLVPPLLIFTGICVAAFRRNNSEQCSECVEEDAPEHHG